ncbi:MAG: sigma-70 family RNA polymerase sigma factor [Deltaproteobacteria bacterium]|nr:sigma-70 family RNA polymerase sigma factor [Deltaproteobacteria bacterium]
MRALAGIRRLEDPAALGAWLTSIAVLTARGCIRRRQARIWVRFLSSEELPEAEARSASAEQVEAVRTTYRILDRLRANERSAFAHRSARWKAAGHRAPFAAPPGPVGPHGGGAARA